MTSQLNQYLKVTPEVAALLTYSNLKFVSVELSSFTARTPLDNFFSNKSVFESNFVVVHVSDAFRLLLLWKYGGVYYDTDVISLLTVENQPQNFACDDGEGDILSNAIIRLDAKIGRHFAETFMDYMSDHYNGAEWGTNGPIVITKCLSQMCRTNSTKEMIKMEQCDGFHVLAQKTCYPVDWWHWKKLFDERYADNIMKMINGAMTIHLWNTLSKRKKINIDKDTAFNRIAQIYCPRVFESMVEGNL